MSDAINAMTVKEFEEYLFRIKDRENEWRAKAQEHMALIHERMDGIDLYLRTALELQEILEHEMYLFKECPKGRIDEEQRSVAMNTTALKLIAVGNSIDAFKQVTNGA